MKIGIIDADLLGNTRHRFPNLACMKLSAWHWFQGDDVTLMLDWDTSPYDKVYISKVFVKTRIPGEPDNQCDKTEANVIDWYAHNEYLQDPKITYGGTGFFYDKAPPLDPAIEHIMPDYHLYDDWVYGQIAAGKKRSQFVYYLDYSIGYLTRGCFRGCEFCVNRNCKHSRPASTVMEFYDEHRKYLCFLDDNFLACPQWRELIATVRRIGKPFEFKQGLDERLLTDEKCSMMATWRYKGEMLFAFDNIDDAPLIERNMALWRSHSNRLTKFYCFCGYDRQGNYNAHFWRQDILDLFQRFRILSKYHCLPYVMRHENHKNSPYRGMYVTLARWANQPAFFKKKTFREFCEITAKQGATSALQYLAEFEKACSPEELQQTIDAHFGW